jgi:hypothetical protein
MEMITEISLCRSRSQRHVAPHPDKERNRSQTSIRGAHELWPKVWRLSICRVQEPFSQRLQGQRNRTNNDAENPEKLPSQFQPTVPSRQATAESDLRAELRGQMHHQRNISAYCSHDRLNNIFPPHDNSSPSSDSRLERPSRKPTELGNRT